MKTSHIKLIFGGLFFVVYTWSLYLMLKITLQYIPINTDVAFLSIKQDFIHLPHFRIAFFVHVFSAIFVLFAGYTQFSSTLRQKVPKLHRWSGWLYAAVTILLAGPSGFVIGLYANGGWTSQLGFCLLAVLWVWFTWKAIAAIRKRDFKSHQKWMVRSYSLALSAITLRAWKFAIVAMFHPRPMDVYQIVAWLGWVLNLIIAEIIIIKFLKK